MRWKGNEKEMKGGEEEKKNKRMEMMEEIYEI